MKIILSNVQRFIPFKHICINVTELLSVPSSWRGERGKEDSFSNIQVKEVEDCVVRTDAQLGDLIRGDLLLPVPSIS